MLIFLRYLLSNTLGVFFSLYVIIWGCIPSAPIACQVYTQIYYIYIHSVGTFEYKIERLRQKEYGNRVNERQRQSVTGTRAKDRNSLFF